MATMTVRGTTDDLELLIHIDRKAEQTLQRQLIEQLRQAILGGLILPGRRLPSTRGLANLLGVSRNIAIAAYDELYAEGYLVRRQGSGTYVDNHLPNIPRPTRLTPAETPRWIRQELFPLTNIVPPNAQKIVFKLGTIDISQLPLGTWRSIWREVIAKLPPTHYGSPTGDPELRGAIADYLGRARAVLCTPEDIIITSSAAQALDLVARVVLTPGDAVGFEEPGYNLARQILLVQGASIMPIRVNDDGLQVQALPIGPSAPLLVYVTPSHQFPLGVRMSVVRRMALLEWAVANDSLIIEDDYDSEFRYDITPLPSLASLDKDGRVVYIGTFSKVLTPALRVAYLVAPPLLHERIEQLKLLTDFHTSWPLQRALYAFITQGHLERHIQRMRRFYAEKHKLLTSVLAPISHLAKLRGLEAGLHGYLELRTDLDARQIAYEASKRGVLVDTVDDFYLGTPDRNGLVLGYGELSLTDIVHGANVLAEVIKQCACAAY